MIDLHHIIEVWLENQDINYEVSESSTRDIWFIRRKGKMYNANYGAVVHICLCPFALTQGRKFPFLRMFIPHDYEESRMFMYETIDVDVMDPNMLDKLKAYLVDQEKFYIKRYGSTAVASAWLRLQLSVRTLFEPVVRFLSLSRLHP